jgi:hypothetical protein
MGITLEGENLRLHGTIEGYFVENSKGCFSKTTTKPKRSMQYKKKQVKN